MLRQGVRQRKEYLLKRAQIEHENALRAKKSRIKNAVEEGRPLAPEDRDLELQLRGRLDLEDANALAAIDADDEYAFAATREPRILLTTSREPSSRLMEFVKELKFMLPGAERINRGRTVIKELIEIAKTNEISDVVVVHEHRGIPDGLVISHMPLGPTIYFTIEDVKLRHDFEDISGHMQTAPPHLVFDNFTSKLGERVKNTLRYLFPPPSVKSQRVVSFINRGDRIFVRNHLWQDNRHAAIRHQHIKQKVLGGAGEAETDADAAAAAAVAADPAEKAEGAEDKTLRGIDLSEQGPRFVLKPYRIELGTMDMKNLELEWALRSFINKAKPQLG